MTFCAFFEVQSVQTMIRPAAARKRKGVRAGVLSAPMRWLSLPAPLAA